MLKTIIVFPDGTELSSGPDSVNAIQNFLLTECVNAGDELTIGSVCCNSIEVKVFTPSGDFSVEAGTEVTVYRQVLNELQKVGVFILDKPTRVSANTMKLVGYDRVSKLDKDLTAWLAEYDAWDVEPIDFAEDICNACGLHFAHPIDLPNSWYRIEQFSKTEVTGRKLMKWIAELCCSFCCANADGDIEFAWYKETGAEISATGDNYYFQNGLSYDDFVTEPIGAAQIRLSDSENGVPWPVVDEETNSYIITGNPMMPNSISSQYLENILSAIGERLGNVSYTPCKVSVPARMDIHAGDIVHITNKNGKRIKCYVMTKTQNGLKDTLECVGSKRRDSTQAVNNKTPEDIAESTAQNAVRAQTSEEIFRKLTNDGQIQGIYQQDGRWYINGEFAQVFNLVANYITTGRLQSKDKSTYFDLDSGEISAVNSAGRKITLSPGVLLGEENGDATFLLYSFGNGMGALNLGGCMLLGRADALSIRTLCVETGAQAAYDAIWKDIDYTDAFGTPKSMRVLARREDT